MSEELKPCPFCGGTNIQMQGGSPYRWVQMYCPDCETTSGDSRVGKNDAETRANAVTAWNTRTPDHTALVRQLVEALADTLDDSRECLVEDESRWGGFRKDRIQYRKDQIAKYEALITAAKEAGYE